jgi:hypothetical protein
MSSLVLLFQGIAQALAGKPTPLSRAEQRYLQTYDHCAPRDDMAQRGAILFPAASAIAVSHLIHVQGATPST